MEPTLPVFWSNGLDDKEVPPSYGEEAVAFLRDTLPLPADKIVYKTYNGLEHTVNDEVLDDLSGWLTSILS